MSATLARLLVFGSSAALLVLEIVAGRLMAPYSGVSLETFTGIIGVVLLGIAVGAWAGGTTADRVDPRKWVGAVLILAGVLVLMTPTIVDLLGPLMRGGEPLRIVVLATGAFLLPALALASVPPMVVKLRLHAIERTGTVVGSLSAISTLGALIGTFLTGFVLVAAVPVRPLVLGMGAALVVAGLALSARDIGRRLTMFAMVGTLTSVGLLGMQRGPCQYETTYFCAVIEVDHARPTGRTLWLDTLRHSYVDLQDPTYLDLRYTRTIADVIAEVHGGPVTGVYLGGGGFTLPRYVAATHPGSTATVFEIDGALVDLTRRELGVSLSDSLRVEIGDARLRLPDHAADSFDLVVGDAFGGLSVPWHLTTREFLREIDRVLTPDGVYVINLIDYPSLGFARAEAATLRDAFAHIAVIAPSSYLRGERGGNFVLVGSQRPLPVEAIQARIAERTDQEAIWADNDVARFTADAHVLTDDFAPVDQLLSRP